MRVRSVQVHDRPVERAEAGQRVAVALPGVERGELRRGDALVAPGAYPLSYRLDVALDELEPIADGARVHVHHGTAEHQARVVRAGEHWAQLRLASRAVAARGDRVVLREGTTLGGGARARPDASAPRRSGALRAARARRRRLPRPRAGARGLAELISAPRRTGSSGRANGSSPRTGSSELRADLRARIQAADPLDPGIPVPPEPWARDVLPLAGVERRGARLYLPGSRGEPRRAGRRGRGARVPPGGVRLHADRRRGSWLAAYLEREGRVVRLGGGLAIGAAAYAEARALAVTECESEGSITLARFRDLLGTGRKPAQLLLERFDAEGLTRRVGDERVLRRKARTG